MSSDAVNDLCTGGASDAPTVGKEGIGGDFFAEAGAIELGKACLDVAAEGRAIKTFC